jgi:hypothetical protein
MTMTIQITEVAVTIEDSLRHANDEFGRRKASVTVKGIVPEGEAPEAAIEYIRRLSDAKVNEILYNKPARQVPYPTDAGATALEPACDPSKTEAPNAAPASAPTPAVDPKATKPKAAKTAKEANNDPAGLGIQSLPPAEKAAEPAKPVDTTITDLELANAITKKNNALGKPEVISALLVKFGGRPAPKQVRDIAQDQRKAFLAELDGLS